MKPLWKINIINLIHIEDMEKEIQIFVILA